LLRLDPTDTERTQARHTITKTLTLKTNPREVNYLIDTLLRLDPTDTERTQARHTITTALALPKTTPWGVNYLINALLKLDPTDTERTQARHTITTALNNADSSILHELVGLLRRLTPVHDWLTTLGIENA